MRTLVGFCFMCVLTSNASFAGPKFSRVQSVFSGAASVSPASLTNEGAWAGYCVNPNDLVTDALLGYQFTNDPVMGPSIKTAAFERSDSSNFYVRMNADFARQIIAQTESSRWLDGVWRHGELHHYDDPRFDAVLRWSTNMGTREHYLVAERQCRSEDGHSCRGKVSDPWILYAACYYFAQKY